MKCPRCEQENPPQAKFCLECGIRLSSTANTDGSSLQTQIDDLSRALTEAAEQQTATAEILRVISSSPSDVQPVFDAIARRVVALCGGRNAIVLRFDGEMLHLAGHHGVSPEGLERNQRAFPRRPWRDSPTGRAFLDRSVVHVPDRQAATEFVASTAQGAGSLLAVPLLREQEAIGVIGVTRNLVGPFSSQQVELLKTFADQAVIAIENVRLFNETKEALDQQTATSEVLRVIASSPTELQPVLDAMAESVARLCAVYDAVIWRLEGDSLRVVAHHGPVGHWEARVIPVLRGTVTGRTVLDRQTVQVTDLQAEVDEFPEGSAFARQFGHRSIVSVPLLREDVAIGVIALRRAEVQPFTEKQIALLQTFADQAVIAMENVRLFNETKAALEQQTATSEILRIISSSPTDVQPVFDAIAASASRLCGGVAAIVTRFDGEMIHLVAHHNPRPGIVPVTARLYPRRPSRDTTTGRAILDRKIVHIPDAEKDPELAPHLARDLDARTFLAVPILHDGQPIGAISVSSEGKDAFAVSQMELLKIFADQAVIAIENVRLFNETKEALEQQTATSEILRVISSSPTDVQPVFDAIVCAAVGLCQAVQSNVQLFDGQLIHFVAAHNIGPAAMEIVQRIYPMPPNRNQTGSRAILDNAVVHVPDVLEDPEYLHELAVQGGWRSVLSVPMVGEGRPIGAITVTRMEPGLFSDSEIALLRTFADQAVIAIENVRLFSELQSSNCELTTALDTQTATSDILRVISRSQTDVQPVFDAILQSAVRLLGGYSGTVTRVVGDQIEIAALTSTDATGDAAQRERYPQSLRSGGSHATAIRNRTPFNIADTQTDPGLPEPVRAFARIRGYRGLVVVPLLRQDEVLGAISVTRRETGGFTKDEITLLQTFADQAVIAIENARLLSELQERTQELTRSVGQLTALAEVGRAVSSTLDLETVLTTIVSRAVELSGLDEGVVFEYDEGEEAFVQRAATEQRGGRLAEARRTTRVRKGEGVVGRTALTLEPAQVADIIVPGAYESRIRENLIASGVRALLAVPMVREGRLIGTLVVARHQPGTFADGTIDLLRTFATQSALAIQNARLFREIEDKSHQLEVVSQHKSEFLANMSHELRTPLNAIIGFSEVLSERMFGELNEKQDEYLKDIHASGQHLLSLINDILDLSKIEAGRMELEVSDFDLPTALDNALTLVRERAGRRGVALDMNVDERLGQIRGDERKVRQVVLNLLSNAIKFTPEGGRIEVLAAPTDGLVEVSVSDTGVGVAPEDQEAVFEEFRQVGTADKKVEGTGLGLTLCRKFVELHGGKIWVKSQVGQGSTFTFTLPVRRGE